MKTLESLLYCLRQIFTIHLNDLGPAMHSKANIIVQHCMRKPGDEIFAIHYSNNDVLITLHIITSQ